MLAADARTGRARVVTRVLVLGGYGGFGGRVSRSLADAGHQVVVAGRSLARARTFCAGDARLTPAAVHRDAVAAALTLHRPAILVDASGPFQGADYDVATACVAAGVHYLDIADARDFVCGIGALDEAARHAGVVVLAGGSSVPALSGAAVRALTDGMEQVASVDIAISASNRAAAGPAVTTAILTQVGQPMRRWRGRRWITSYGWQEGREVTFEVTGKPPIGRRRVALVDVPDLALLPDRLPGRPAASFRAGTEMAIGNRALWLASWPVRWGWLQSLQPFGRVLTAAQRLVRGLGTDRSAMQVVVVGLAGTRRVERRWTLVASRGDGPRIPALSIAPLVARILRGDEVVGARDAGASLTLADYTPVFSKLAIAHETVERPLAPPLYARVMGDRFAALPAAVRGMHATLGEGGAAGEATVEGAGNIVARLISRVMGFPPAGRHDLHVAFEADGDGEIWTRSFGDRSFRSRLGGQGATLVERFGPLRFAFDLPSDARGLTMVMTGWLIGRLPLPLALAPRSRAREWEEGGRFHFDVPIALPLIGRLVHYRGWLERL